MTFGRRIGLAVSNWRGPLNPLEARAVSNQHHNPEPAVRVWDLDDPTRPPIVRIEPIEPGSPEWYGNGADASCEVCGGHGRVNRFVDGSRKTVPCECFEEWRCETA